MPASSAVTGVVSNSSPLGAGLADGAGDGDGVGSEVLSSEEVGGEGGISMSGSSGGARSGVGGSSAEGSVLGAFVSEARGAAVSDEVGVVELGGGVGSSGDVREPEEESVEEDEFSSL